jgi:hypothetical protein
MSTDAADSWIIWLTPQTGETFLGLTPSTPPRADRRFCILGKFEAYDASGVGIWLEVDFAQELEIPDNTAIKTWEVNPRSCLIRWSDIRYIQKGEHPKKGKIGFVPVGLK